MSMFDDFCVEYVDGFGGECLVYDLVVVGVEGWVYVEKGGGLN